MKLIFIPLRINKSIGGGRKTTKFENQIKEDELAKESEEQLSKKNDKTTGKYDVTETGK